MYCCHGKEQREKERETSVFESSKGYPRGTHSITQYTTRDGWIILCVAFTLRRIILLACPRSYQTQNLHPYWIQYSSIYTRKRRLHLQTRWTHVLKIQHFMCFVRPVCDIYWGWTTANAFTTQILPQRIFVLAILYIFALQTYISSIWVNVVVHTLLANTKWIMIVMLSAKPVVCLSAGCRVGSTSFAVFCTVGGGGRLHWSVRSLMFEILQQNIYITWFRYASGCSIFVWFIALIWMAARWWWANLTDCWIVVFCAPCWHIREQLEFNFRPPRTSCWHCHVMNVH